ncbi:hypothetical protein Tco_0542086 [Tanacetum coccineum]
MYLTASRPDIMLHNVFVSMVHVFQVTPKTLMLKCCQEDLSPQGKPSNLGLRVLLRRNGAKSGYPTDELYLLEKILYTTIGRYLVTPNFFNLYKLVTSVEWDQILVAICYYACLGVDLSIHWLQEMLLNHNPNHLPGPPPRTYSHYQRPTPIPNIYNPPPQIVPSPTNHHLFLHLHPKHLPTYSIPTPTSPPPPPPPETEPPTDEHIYEEQSPVHHHFSPSQAQAPSHMPTDDLLQTVPKSAEVVGFLKRSNLDLTIQRMEEPEVQGRKSQADPQDSSKQGLVTPPTTKAHASGEEQEEEIKRPNKHLEASKISQKNEVNTASKVNTGSIELNTVIEQDSTAGENKGQREGKAPCSVKKRQEKTKEQIYRRS